MADGCQGNECAYGSCARTDGQCGSCCSCIGGCLATADHHSPDTECLARALSSLIEEIKNLRYRLEGLEK